jgi:hypothetical protein
LHPERREAFNPVDAAGRVYGLLTPDAREALWRGEPIRFGYPAEQGRVPIPADIAAGVVASGLGNLSRHTDPVDGRDIRSPFRSVERVRGELVLEGRGIAARLRVRVRTVGSYGLDDNRQRVEWTFDEPVEGRHAFFDPEFRGPYLDAAAAGLRQPLVLRAFPEKETEDTSLYLPDALERLSEHVPYPVVADDYVSGGFGGQLSSDGKPLARFLDRVCRVFQRTCSYRGGYLRFRHHDWATRRAMEPPARLVRRLEQSVRLRGALTLAELVEIGGLTPEQADGVHYRLRDRHPGFGRLLEADLEQSAPMLRLLHARFRKRSGASSTPGDLCRSVPCPHRRLSRSAAVSRTAWPASPATRAPRTRMAGRSSPGPASPRKTASRPAGFMAW